MSAIRTPPASAFGVLGLVRMVRAGVDLQLAQLGRGELVLGEHALHRLAQHLLRAPVELLAERALAQPARVAGVVVVDLLVELLAGDVDLLGVHDDHEVARVDVRRVGRLALAAQHVRDLRREPAERLGLGVDHVPVALDLARLGGVRLHQRPELYWRMRRRRANDNPARSHAPDATFPHARRDGGRAPDGRATATRSPSPRWSTRAAPPRARSARGWPSRRPARWSGRSPAAASSPTSTCAPRRCSRGGPPQLLQYGISDDDAFDVGLPCGGEIEVFVQMLDPEELDRIDAAVQTRRAAVGHDHPERRRRRRQGVRRGRGPLERRPHRRDDVRRALRARRRSSMIFGAVDTGQALCRMAKQVGFTTIVSDARAKFATPERLPDADEIIVGWPAMAYDAPRARRRHLRRRPDARPALRRARAGPGAALRRAVHRRARQPACAGHAPRAPAERGLHRRRDRAHPRAARPRHRRGHPGRDRGLDPGRDPGRQVGARRRPALAEERAHHRSRLDAALPQHWGLTPLLHG